MAQDLHHETHDHLHAHSYKNLEKARQAAAVKKGYDSTTTHTEVWQLFQQQFGQDPYEWQFVILKPAILCGHLDERRLKVDECLEYHFKEVSQH